MKTVTFSPSNENNNKSQKRKPRQVNSKYDYKTTEENDDIEGDDVIDVIQYPHLSRHYIREVCGVPIFPTPATAPEELDGEKPLQARRSFGRDTRHDKVILSLKCPPPVIAKRRFNIPVIKSSSNKSLELTRGIKPVPPPIDAKPTMSPRYQVFVDKKEELLDGNLSATDRTQVAITEGHEKKQWIQYFDDQSGWPYYYNPFTNESTYDEPDSFSVAGISQSYAQQDEYEEGDNADIYSTTTDQQQNGSDYDYDETYNNTDWVEYWDEEVEAKYYYNIATEEASWVIPAELQ